MTFRVAIMPEYSFPLAYGGIEIRATRSMELLKTAGYPASWLDPYDRFQEFELLHVFGNPPSILESVEYAAVRGRVVVDAVLGGSGYSITKRLLRLRSAMISATGARDEISRVRMAFSLANRIVAITPGESQLITRFYDVDPAKITVIPNRVDDALWNAEPTLFRARFGDYPFVLFVGTITPRKNPLMLVHALDRIGVAGVFIGPSDSQAIDYGLAFQKAIQNHSRHRWLGRLDHADPLLASAYSAASLFCLPSQNEGQPQVVLQAMAAGTKAIVADRPWAGFYPFDALAKARLSVSALADAIALSLEDEKKGEPLGDDFRSSRYPGAIIKVYEEAMK